MWDFCTVHAISLREDGKDRRPGTEASIARAGFRPTWHLTERSPMGGVVGCFEAHVGVAQKALRCGHAGQEWAVIFEDDARLFEHVDADSLAAVEAELRQFCSSWPKEEPCWIQLGYLACDPRVAATPVPNSKHIFAISKSFCTHAYLVNRQKLRQIAELRWAREQTGFDALRATTGGPHFAVTPMLFYQSDDPSLIGMQMKPTDQQTYTVTTVQRIIGMRQAAEFSEFVATQNQLFAALLAIGAVVLAAVFAVSVWGATSPKTSPEKDMRVQIPSAVAAALSGALLLALLVAIGFALTS